MAEKRKFLIELMVEGVKGKVFQCPLCGCDEVRVVKVVGVTPDGELTVRQYMPPGGRLSPRTETISPSWFRAYSLLTTEEVRRYKRGEAPEGFKP